MVAVQSFHRRLISLPVAIEMITFLGEGGGRLTDIPFPLELMSFVADGHCEIIQLIHRLGGSLTCCDCGGRNILHMAVLHHQLDIIRWIVSDSSLTCLLSMKDRLNRTPIDDANMLPNGEEILRLFDGLMPSTS